METIKEVKWVITGSNSQLARALISELEINQQEFTEYNHEEFDISDPIQVDMRLSYLSPAVVVNTAAFTNVEEAEKLPEVVFKANATGPELLANACHNYGLTLIHISSDYVFSGDRTEPYSVSEVTSPVSTYGKSKAMGEAAILQSKLRSSYILRTAWLYGPEGANFVKKIALFALNGIGKIRVVDDQVGQPTSTNDLASRIYEIISNNVPFGIWHTTNSGSASWYEFAQEIFTLCGEDPSRVIPIKTNELQQSAKRPRYSVLSQSKWESVNMAEMRNWKVSLAEHFPAIIKSLREVD